MGYTTSKVRETIVEVRIFVILTAEFFGFITLFIWPAEAKEDITYFYFHFRDELASNFQGDRVMLNVTTQNGTNYVWNTTLPAENTVDEQVTGASLRPGDAVNGCIINFNQTNYNNCSHAYINTINEADFYLRTSPK